MNLRNLVMFFFYAKTDFHIFIHILSELNNIHMDLYKSYTKKKKKCYSALDLPRKFRKIHKFENFITQASKAKFVEKFFPVI